MLEKLKATDMDNYPVKDPLIEQEISLFTRNIGETIQFLMNDCTGEEFIWLSEIFDEIVEKTKSKEFIKTLRETAKKFPSECSEYYILDAINSCEDYL